MTLEDIDEEPSDGLALFLRVGDACELAQEQLAFIGMDQGDVVVIAEESDDLISLVHAHHAVVDEDACQLIADGLVDQNGSHGRIDAAG